MKNGVLNVSEQASAFIDANGIKLNLTVQGENLIFGNAALDKNQNVKALVQTIKEIDPSAIISLDNIKIQSETGWFTQISKGSYNLIITITNLETIDAILNTVIEIENVNLNAIEWLYDDYSAKVKLITEAVSKTKAKAETMAGALGKTIVGIKSCADSYDIPDNKAITQEEAKSLGYSMLTKPRSKANADMGTLIKGKKEIKANAFIQFILKNIEE